MNGEHPTNVLERPPERETYAMGYSDIFLQLLRRRSAGRNAAHLLPLLQPGMDLLDLGCGPQREMERLLEFQAGLGGSVILLSATLPLGIRRRLTDAFAKGLGGEIGNASLTMDYPLATVCAAEVRHAAWVAGRTGRAARFPCGSSGPPTRR